MKLQMEGDGSFLKLGFLDFLTSSVISNKIFLNHPMAPFADSGYKYEREYVVYIRALVTGIINMEPTFKIEISASKWNSKFFMGIAL